jgi:hypothetical protein
MSRQVGGPALRVPAAEHTAVGHRMVGRAAVGAVHRETVVAGMKVGFEVVAVVESRGYFT